FYGFSYAGQSRFWTTRGEKAMILPLNRIAYIPSSFGPALAPGSPLPDKIVLHAMGEFIGEPGDESMYAPYFLESIKLSAHRFITPSGVIIVTRRDDQRAHHAKGHNMSSWGVEFLVPGIHNLASLKKATATPYLSEVQYRAGV